MNYPRPVNKAAQLVAVRRRFSLSVIAVLFLAFITTMLGFGCLMGWISNVYWKVPASEDDKDLLFSALVFAPVGAVRLIYILRNRMRRAIALIEDAPSINITSKAPELQPEMEP